jgi:hypothetical protein
MWDVEGPLAGLVITVMGLILLLCAGTIVILSANRLVSLAALLVFGIVAYGFGSGRGFEEGLAQGKEAAKEELERAGSS